MRIWVIGRAFPTKINNYNGSFEFEQAEMLKRHGNEVSYFCVETVPFYKKTEKAGLKISEENGIEVYRYYCPFQPLPPEIMVCIRSMLLHKMMKIRGKKSNIADVIHVHYPSLMGTSFCKEYRKLGTKIICTEHWTKVLSPKLNYVYKRVIRNYREYANGFISVGKPLNDKIEQITEVCNPKCPTFVVPNVVNDAFSFSQTESTEKFEFVAIGRLVFCKRFDLLIEAFCKAFPDDINVHLTIVGNGSEFEVLNELIRKLNLEQKVELIGSVSHDRIPAIIHQSNVLVCSSNLETFGVPVIEALCCGRPVITTQAIGFLEYIRDNEGIIIETDSESQMINALVDVRKNYMNYNLKQISDDARGTFGEEAVYKSLQSIYTM